MRTQVEEECQTCKLDGNEYVTMNILKAPSKRQVTFIITSLAIFKTKCNPRDTTVFQRSLYVIII